MGFKLRGWSIEQGDLQRKNYARRRKFRKIVPTEKAKVNEIETMMAGAK